MFPPAGPFGIAHYLDIAIGVGKIVKHELVPIIMSAPETIWKSLEKKSLKV